MSLLKNKHLLTAAIVTPVLALIGYFGLDLFIGEAPQVAEEGQSYSLVEKPDCRWDSGHCGLKNGDFELTLSTEPLAGGQLLLKLESVFPLEGVMAAVIEREDEEKQPSGMYRMSDDGLSWSMSMPRPDPERDRLLLVASARGSLYFGDAALKFTTGKSSLD